MDTVFFFIGVVDEGGDGAERRQRCQKPPAAGFHFPIEFYR